MWQWIIRPFITPRLQLTILQEWQAGVEFVLLAVVIILVCWKVLDLLTARKKK